MKPQYRNFARIQVTSQKSHQDQKDKIHYVHMLWKKPLS